MFGLFKKRHRSPVIDDIEGISPKQSSEDAAEIETNEEELGFADEYKIELLTPVPGINVIPSDWSRDYLVERTSARIRVQSIRIIIYAIALIGVSSFFVFASWGMQNISSEYVETRANDIKKTLDTYGTNVNTYGNVKDVFDYTNTFSVSDQCKSIIKTCVESGIVVHKINFDYKADSLSQNVKNSFETARSVPLSKVGILGVWLVDGTFISESPDNRKTNELWISETNKQFTEMFKNTGTNVYVDISSKGQDRENYNRHELVVLFWKPI